MSRPRHHHHRSWSNRLKALIFVCQERYNLLLLDMQNWLHRPRVSSRIETMEDGRIKKKLRISRPRPLPNFTLFSGVKSQNSMLVLIMIFVLFLLFSFGEAYLNRDQIMKMTTGGR